ncbi:MAG: hypothetical protein OEV64_07895 [Desulfobulbaceae bacterium]|nr:hypothetical protein [Desulfobulbaceae bacterium]
MKRYRANLWFVMAMFLLMSASVLAGPRDEQVANVAVYVHTVNGQPAYTYTIKNTGNYPIIGLSIGFDHYTGSSELSGKHPHEVTSPDSWESSVIALEESQYYEVRWEPSLGTEGLAIGASKSGFTIVMRNPTPQLLSGHWTAIFSGPPTYASSAIEVLDGPPHGIDVLPPSITVEIEPSMIWPPNKKMVNISANVTVSDDRDQTPVVSLVAITCNECDPITDVRGAEIGAADFQFSVRAARTGQAKPGRVYAVVYSATDAAGNRSEASATIVVPHDQRKK